MATKPKKKARKRGAKPPKINSALRGVVADKVRARLNLLYGPQSYDGWLEKTGLTKGTLQRVLNGDSGLTIEILEQVAKGVKLEVPQLFEPLTEMERRMLSTGLRQSPNGLENSHGLS